MPIPDIRELVPHAGPMVLLDRVAEVDGEALCAEVTIHAGSMFYEAGIKGVGTWVGIEYMAQAIAAHAGYEARLRGEPVKIGFLLGARRYDCRRPLFALGDLVRIRVRRELQADNGLSSFDCRIEVGDAPVATAIVTVFLPANVQNFMEGSQE